MPVSWAGLFVTGWKREKAWSTAWQRKEAAGGTHCGPVEGGTTSSGLNPGETSQPVGSWEWSRKHTGMEEGRVKGRVPRKTLKETKKGMIMEAEEGGMCRTGKLAAENMPAPREDSGPCWFLLALVPIAVRVCELVIPEQCLPPGPLSPRSSPSLPMVMTSDPETCQGAVVPSCPLIPLGQLPRHAPRATS
ncbi:hypothetical protein VULLAG_LOCUS10229 [Vulpes lagopus]